MRLYKRYLIVAVVLAALLLVVLFRWLSEGSVSTPEASEPLPEALAGTNSRTLVEAAKVMGEPVTADTHAVATNHNEPEQSKDHRAFPDLPVAFYGLVLDQDSNALQSVKIDVEVTQWDVGSSPDPDLKTAHVEEQTGADGSFQVGGLSGHRVTVTGLAKDGYEPEVMRRHYGEYGPQTGSVNDPVVFYMWSTNLHEPLLTGDREFKIVPDGRHYGIDLATGAIAEGEGGDLVVWIQRPESVESPGKYAWSCGMAAPGGGLKPAGSRRSPMYRAPAGEYTNVFDFHVEYNTPAKSGMSLDNQFYVRLRNGLYGRVSADFWTIHRDWATYRKDPAFGQIHLSYAINPSGSRLLR